MKQAAKAGAVDEEIAGDGITPLSRTIESMKPSTVALTDG